MESWAHTGTMQQAEGAAGGSGTAREEAEGAAGGSGTAGEEEVLQVTDSDDSEDDPIMKEEAGAKPKLLLNPYFVGK